MKNIILKSVILLFLSGITLINLTRPSEYSFEKSDLRLKLLDMRIANAQQENVGELDGCVDFEAINHSKNGFKADYGYPCFNYDSGPEPCGYAATCEEDMSLPELPPNMYAQCFSYVCVM